MRLAKAPFRPSPVGLSAAGHARAQPHALQRPSHPLGDAPDQIPELPPIRRLHPLKRSPRRDATLLLD
jgi:hypothetical protein